MMKRRRSPSRCPDGEKKKFSKYEVQKMVEQEVHSAVEQTETKLDCLLEKVQQMEREMEYESAIHNLQAQIDRVKRKGDAALHYIRKLGINGTQNKKQEKSLLPSPVVTATVDITRSDSEDEIVSNMDKKRREDRGELFQRTMETTKAALKKMRTDNEALKAAIADVKTEPPPPTRSGSSSPVSPQCKRAAMSMKTEAEEQVEEQKADRMKVKRLSDSDKETTKAALKKMCTDDEALKAAIADVKTEPPPPTRSGSSSPVSPQCKRAAMSMKTEAEEQVEEQKADRMKVKRLSDSDKDEISYPPLPAMPFPSFLSMEAASYNIPQRPTLQLALIRNPPGLSVLWNMEVEDPSAPPMASYSVFMAMEKVKGSGVFPEWKTLGEVTAIPLPMCVMISKYKPGYKACFTVVGKDQFGRYGPYSKIVPATIPE